MTRNGAVLFTDLVGFTEFNDAAGDVAAVEVLDAQTAMASGAISDCADARIVKELGDGLMIWSGSADEAVTAAVDFMRLVSQARCRGDFPLAVRVGLHHGDAVQRGDDLVGQTVNIAARVCDLAGPNEVLVSDTTIDACSSVPDVRLEPVGPVAMKGVAQPVWLRRIVV